MRRALAISSLLITIVPSIAAAATVSGQVLAPAPRGMAGAPHVALLLEGDAAEPAATPVPTKLDQQWISFIPKVQVVAPGSTLALRDRDDDSHTVHARLGGETLFDVATVPHGPEQVIRLDREGVVVITCDIHAEMSGLVVVTKRRHTAVTDGDGRFTMADVPPGTWRVHAIWPHADPKLAPLEGDPPGALVATITVAEGAAPVEIRLPVPVETDHELHVHAGREHQQQPGVERSSWLDHLVPDHTWPSGGWAIALGFVALLLGGLLALGTVVVADTRGWSRMGAMLCGCLLTVLATGTMLLGLETSVAIALGTGVFLGVIIFAADDQRWGSSTPRN